MEDTGQLPRKLAVILHADVVGSTELVRLNEGVAHERIRGAFNRLSKKIRDYGGNTHELRGDALLAEFQRVSDAVAAALTFQAENTEHNLALDDDIRPQIRVGISLGEVIIADNTLTGPDVVLAQRLEQLATPGGLCISQAAYQSIPRRLPYDFEDLGDQTVKGFDDPVRGYAVTLKQDEEPPAPDHVVPARFQAQRPIQLRIVGVAVTLILVAAGLATWFQPWKTDSQPTSIKDTSTTPPDKLSVAVLPFENMSDDSSQEYFSDGLTEDIITDLARLSGLLVIARNSSFAYKGQAGNMQQIGRELGVRYLVEGSVRKAGNRVRVVAQLIDSESGMHVWADRYDRNLDDVFDLQDELTRTIVDALTVNLTEEEAEALDRPRGTSFDAYDVLLRGNELLARFSPEDAVGARQFYRQAIALNPVYARAHANLAFSYAQEALFNWTDDRDEAIRLGLAAAEDARRLDDKIPQLHFTLANLYGAQSRWEEAAQAVRRSLALEPSYADGATYLATTLTFLGDLDGAANAIELAKRLDPHYSYIVRWIEGRIFYLQGKYEDAAGHLEEAARRNPGFDQTRIVLAATYAQLGRIEDAEWEAEEVLSVKPEFTISDYISTRGFHDKVLEAKYIEGLRKAGFPE